MALYHASQQTNLSTIKPQRTFSNDKYIGNYVFATTNKKLALMYLVPKGIPTLMNPDDPQPNIVICSELSKYITKDQGGAIYKLPSNDFIKSPQKELSMYEMASKQSIKPLTKNIYKNTIQALQSADIKIYFVNDATFAKLIKNPNQDKLINGLRNYPAVR